MIPTERQIADEMKRYGLDRMPAIRRIQQRVVLQRGRDLNRRAR